MPHHSLYCEVALFFENGPYIINNANKLLRWNDYGWDMVRAVWGRNEVEMTCACRSLSCEVATCFENKSYAINNSVEILTQ